MPKFLIDVNLPAKFSLWHNEDFIFVKDIDPFLQDSHIWEFAKENNLIIVTKDRDFYDRVLLSSPPPKVIHVRG
jgi:predicted nuclease of predicted toxin-antitoxin system